MYLELKLSMKVMIFSNTLRSSLLNILTSSISKFKTFDVLKSAARLIITLFSISSIF
jgi:hypothetical protein